MEDIKPLIATPMSDLIVEPNFKEVIALSDCLETRDKSIISDYPKQQIFHCELQPIHTLSNENIDYLKKIKLQKPELKLISFHIATCYKSPKIIKNIFYPRGEKVKRKCLLENARKNFIIIKKIFGNKIKVAIENNNYYKTEAYDDVTDTHFISQIVNENEIYFLLDIAHARITSFNTKTNYKNYINQLPLNRMIQIHIAKPGFDKYGEIFDAHNLPTKDEIEDVILFLKKYPELKYLTIEYYKNTDKLISLLKQLNLKLNSIYGQ